MADHDVPAMVELVANVTGQQQVAYFGYSQVMPRRQRPSRSHGLAYDAQGLEHDYHNTTPSLTAA